MNGLASPHAACAEIGPVWYSRRVLLRICRLKSAAITAEIPEMHPCIEIHLTAMRTSSIMRYCSPKWGVALRLYTN